MKIYSKVGSRNYKEKKMLKHLDEVFAKKIAEDPAFKSKIIPATNQNELQSMYDKYSENDVEFIETKTTTKNTTTTQTEMAKKKSEDIQDVEFEEKITDNKFGASIDDADDNTFVDPFNRENPIVREYVMGKDALGRERTSSEGAKTTFDEPTSFKEAFEIPTYDEDGIEEKSEPAKKSQPKAEKRQPAEPVNPSFDDMSNGKKKRSAKKFAKYIVEAICVLSEKGFVWYANKDINANQLAQYEITGEIDLGLLVTLEDGQEVTIKEFFANQCHTAEQLAVISETEKADLTDALTEVMMEKGIAPTPTQELLLIAGTILGGKALTLFALKSQTNSLLTQLKTMSDPNAPRQVYNEQPQEPQQAPIQAQQVKDEEVVANQTNFDDIDSLADAFNETEMEQVVETIE
jgi:hypothetical protein